MKRLLKKLETLWVSVAFAEAGEYEMSKQLLAREAGYEDIPEICQAI